MAHGDDITRRNETLPIFRDGTPLWHRICCALGYHKPEVRRTSRDHHFPGMRLRDQCGRCDRLLDKQIPVEEADRLAPLE